ncbi:MAG: hypothetical protein JW836_08240 [Deltaproteobacteria bacterium]|nr:hypothetical protein [Deltaproteobacteria bacterium]
MMSPPDPEAPEKKPRRKFTAKYNLQILQEADACMEPGQLGAFLLNLRPESGMNMKNLIHQASAAPLSECSCFTAGSCHINKTE